MEYCIVETAYGAVSGERRDGVNIWRGIPYAVSPEGGLRFQKPRMPESWEGVRDALEFGPSCPQKRTIKGRAAVDATSEDCLTLNIWSPAADGKKRAVFFYIHGGSFAEGAGSDLEYEGSDFAKSGDIVVVTINYRLGVFGFMDFSFVDESFVPNCGLWDILAALRWVNENIGAFGGDAGNVTVCGQSAGAVCVCLLAMIGEARRYMKQGVMMSGIPTLLQAAEQAQSIARRFLEFAGIPDVNAKALLELPAPMIESLQKEFVLQCGLGALTFVPCVNGELITAFPIRAAMDGEAAGIPLLIGTTREELSPAFYKSLSHIVDINEVRKRGVRAENEETKQRIQKVYERYGKRGPKTMISDYAFRIPCVWFAEAYGKNTDTWMYRFDYETFGMRISGLHSFHSSDVPFLFGNFKAGLARYMLILSPVKKGIRKVHRELRGDVLTFMKTGELPWQKCGPDDTPAKCYALPPVYEQASPPEVKQAYDGSEFKRMCLAGESVIQIE